MPAGQKRASDLIKDGYEAPCRYWELNSNPLEEHPLNLWAISPATLSNLLNMIHTQQPSLQICVIYSRQFLDERSGWTMSLAQALTQLHQGAQPKESACWLLVNMGKNSLTYKWQMFTTSSHISQLSFSLVIFVVLYSLDINYPLKCCKYFIQVCCLFLILVVRFANLFCRGKILFFCIAFEKRTHTYYIIYIDMSIYSCVYIHICIHVYTYVCVYIISYISVLFIGKHFAQFC